AEPLHIDPALSSLPSPLGMDPPRSPSPASGDSCRKLGSFPAFFQSVHSSLTHRIIKKTAETILDLRLKHPHSFISTSTPPARFSFINESIVSGVGSIISSNRLCVRISNCSRDFLSACV